MLDDLQNESICKWELTITVDRNYKTNRVRLKDRSPSRTISFHLFSYNYIKNSNKKRK